MRESYAAHGQPQASSLKPGAWGLLEACGLRLRLAAGSVQQRHRVRDHLLGRPPGGPQLANSAVAVRLTQLLPGRLHDQRMVKKLRRLVAAEPPRQLDL